MPRATDDNGGSGGASSGPRRSALLQERSRNTRRELVRTALDLWSARGFETGVEETTVEEIARAAGVTKGTFYFHFAHKEDILLEIGWASAETMVKEAEIALQRDRPAAEIIEQLLTSLARRVNRAPRSAVTRSLGEFNRRSGEPITRPDGLHGFGEAFEMVLAYAVERGELPPALDVADVAALLQSATMDTLGRWASGNDNGAELRRWLQARAELILSGAAVVYGWGSAGRNRA
jgi:AcrR family transcriptional regulator